MNYHRPRIRPKKIACSRRLRRDIYLRKLKMDKRVYTDEFREIRRQNWWKEEVSSTVRAAIEAAEVKQMHSTFRYTALNLADIISWKLFLTGVITAAIIYVSFCCRAMPQSMRANIRFMGDSTPDYSLYGSSSTAMMVDRGSATYAGGVGRGLPPSVVDYMPHGWTQTGYNSSYVAKEEGWIFGNHPEATQADNDRLQQLFKEHQDVFAYSLKDLDGCTMAGSKFDPQLESTPQSTWAKRQKFSDAEEEVVDEKCSELLMANKIRKLTVQEALGVHVHPIVVAAKKDSAGNYTEKRFCVDLRTTNAATKTDPLQMPYTDDLFRDILKSKFYTTFDMRSGFLGIAVEEEAQKQLAFYWKGEVYVYTYMCFGHKNAPAHYQRVMNKLIAEAGVEKNAVVYIDDVVVHANTAEHHYEIVEKLLKVFRKYHMFVHPSKTLIMAQDVEFLGHRIHPGGVSPQEVKLLA